MQVKVNIRWIHAGVIVQVIVSVPRQVGLKANIMFMWDDVFLEPLQDRLDDTVASVGDKQQESLMLLRVRARHEAS